MTVTLAKTIVEPKWTAKDIQATNAHLHARTLVTAIKHVAKLGGEKAVEEFHTELRGFKVDSLKRVGVQSPIELVKMLSEFEANLFNTKIEIWGDEHKAFMTYEDCPMWNSMKKVGDWTEEQEHACGVTFAHSMEMLAKEFGMKSEMKFEGKPTVSFSK